MSFKIYVDGGATSTKIYQQNNNLPIIKFGRINVASFKKTSFKVIQKIAVYLDQHFTNAEVLFGLPGFTTLTKTEIRDLTKFFQKTTVHFLTDIELQIHFKNLFNEKDFLYLVCGTGTVAYLSTTKSVLSGWGHILGDQGSAYEFGLIWIKKAIVNYEKKVKNDFFIKKVLEYFQLQQFNEIKKMYLNQTTIKQQIADFASSILENDSKQLLPFKEMIFSELVKSLSQYLNQIIEWKKIENVYLSGGLFQNDFYFESLKKSILNQNQKINIGRK